MGFGPSFGDYGFSLIANVFPFLFILVFVLIIGTFIFSIFKNAKNAQAPKESAFVRVIAKRTEVRSHASHNMHHQNDHIGTTGTSRTYYYITLEFDNGSRKEYLDVKGLYGLVVEGDTGYAATQGDWIVAFERSGENSYT
ncbi:DUF2500 domain-containing protein [Paenibacillus sp. CAU 1782]